MPVLAAEPGTDPEPAVLQVLQEEYGLSEEEAIARLAAEARANGVRSGLKQFLGDAYAGAWFDSEDLQLVVAITAPKLQDWVKVAGARPVMVKRNLAELKGIMARLSREANRSAQQWNEAVTSWYVDYQTNSVVVEVLPGYQAFTKARISALGFAANAVRIERSAGRPQLLSHVRGGDPAGGCTIGFSVQGGFVWAGHCDTAIGAPVTGHNGQVMGSVAGSDWPDYDRGWVDTNADWTPLPVINGFNDGEFAVTGSVDAIQGTSVCQYGKTTGGPDCGSVTGLNETVTFSGESVPTKGLTKATGVCADFGDSGGPWVVPSTNKGAGTTGGDLQDCEPMYFQPLNDSLNRFNLSLLTDNGNNPPEITTWV